MKRKVYLKLTALEDARRILMEKFSVSPLEVERVHLREAHGRTLAENAVAAVSSPAYHGAAMDGVALKAESTFGASERRPKTFAIGSDAHWINTGQPLPAGTDAVVMIENVVASEDAAGRAIATIEKAAFPWQHVRKLGEDMVATEILLPAGTVLGPYELGALAATGVLRPLVYRAPRVAVIPSGGEMLDIDDVTPEILAGGAKLPESNSLMLTAIARDAGAAARTFPIVPDEPEEIRAAILEAVGGPFELVVVNAGSSAGSRDYTAEIIGELGELFVHGIAAMPGKPTAIGMVEGKPVLGIPGYPVSAAVAFEQLAVPLLAAWQGRRPAERPTADALPVQDIPSRPGMEEFIRVKLGRVDGLLLAVPLPRGAGAVSSLSRADGILRVPAAVEGLKADVPAPVTFIRPPAVVEMALLAIGSHDNTLDLLDSLLRKHSPGHSLTSAHVGSLGGLMALKNGRCHLAGSHLLSSDGLYNREAVREHLAGIPVHLVRLADREQGLMVPAGNPLGIRSLEDLSRKDVTFVNRQRGSGTRVLLDWKLGLMGMRPGEISGYDNEEYTHMSVAAAVLSGAASTGLGVKSSAAALGLEFIPVGVEEYDLVIPDKYWEHPGMRALLEVVRSDEFRARAEAMGGYGMERTGETVWRFEG